LGKILETYRFGQVKTVQAIHVQLLETNWQIGQHIVALEQGGKLRADYGKALFKDLAKDFSLLHGKGFSVSKVKRFRQFYLTYPIGATLSHQLSWSHIVEFLKIDDSFERCFYEKQTLLEKWNVGE
jgi:hypothetical protein